APRPLTLGRRLVGIRFLQQRTHIRFLIHSLERLAGLVGNRVVGNSWLAHRRRERGCGRLADKISSAPLTIAAGFAVLAHLRRRFGWSNQVISFVAMLHQPR